MPACRLTIVILAIQGADPDLPRWLDELGHRVRTLRSSDLQPPGSDADVVDLLIVDSPAHAPLQEHPVSSFRKARPWAGIVLLAPARRAELRQRAFRDGADMCLEKPLSREELAAAIGAMARWLHQVHLARTADCQHLALNQSSLWLRGPVSFLKLSDAESTILAALSQAKGQRLSYVQMSSLVNEEFTTRNKVNLEVRMVRLRSKLHSVGAQQPCLCAVRNSGYQLLIDVHLE